MVKFKWHITTSILDDAARGRHCALSDRQTQGSRFSNGRCLAHLHDCVDWCDKRHCWCCSSLAFECVRFCTALNSTLNDNNNDGKASTCEYLCLYFSNRWKQKDKHMTTHSTCLTEITFWTAGKRKAPPKINNQWQVWHLTQKLCRITSSSPLRLLLFTGRDIKQENRELFFLIYSWIIRLQNRCSTLSVSFNAKSNN